MGEMEVIESALVNSQNIHFYFQLFRQNGDFQCSFCCLWIFLMLKFTYPGAAKTVCTLSQANQLACTDAWCSISLGHMLLQFY